MEENKSYPQIEEEDGSCLTANEPVGAIAYSEACVEPEIYDIPGLPKSWDELMDCVAEGEEEFERGESIPWETATQTMKEHIRIYGS